MLVGERATSRWAQCVPTSKWFRRPSFGAAMGDKVIRSVGVAAKPYLTLVAGTATASHATQLRCTEDGTGSWTPSPPDRTYGNVITYHESRVGSQELRCKATYLDMSTSTLTRGISVAGPNTDIILSGCNTDSDGFPIMVLTAIFEVRSGSTAIGIYTAGYPQERIRRPQLNTDSGWKGSYPWFYFNPNKNIVDEKSVTRLDQTWDNLPVGEIFDDFYQQNRAVIPNCHGTNTYFYFDDVHYQKKKTGAQTWQLIQVP